jgi:hypothetical protein
MEIARHLLPKPPRAAIPPSRLWPNLPVESQAQIARLLADLLRRLAPKAESGRAERLHR